MNNVNLVDLSTLTWRWCKVDIFCGQVLFWFGRNMTFSWFCSQIFNVITQKASISREFLSGLHGERTPSWNPPEHPSLHEPLDLQKSETLERINRWWVHISLMIWWFHIFLFKRNTAFLNLWLNLSIKKSLYFKYISSNVCIIYTLFHFLVMWSFPPHFWSLNN